MSHSLDDCAYSIEKKKNTEEELDYMWICKYPVLFYMDPRMTETTELDVFVDYSDFLHTEWVLKKRTRRPK